MKTQSAMSERAEQMALVKWMSYHPIIKDLFCKNDNEGKRTPLQGLNSKRMGLKRGVPDLFIYFPTKLHHGLWIEVKCAKKYSPSQMQTATWIAQQAFIDTVRSFGYAAEFCYGWIDGKRIIEEYLLDI